MRPLDLTQDTRHWSLEFYSDLHPITINTAPLMTLLVLTLTDTAVLVLVLQLFSVYNTASIKPRGNTVVPREEGAFRFQSLSFLYLCPNTEQLQQLYTCTLNTAAVPLGH